MLIECWENAYKMPIKCLWNAYEMLINASEMFMNARTIPTKRSQNVRKTVIKRPSNAIQMLTKRV